MRLLVLGSSSSGNGYLLRSETTGEVLALEAGIRFDRVKKALDFDIGRIVGCCVTHEHGDHAKYVPDMLQSWINVCMSHGTAEALGLLQPEGGRRVPCAWIKPFEKFSLGGFDIMPFPVQHDAAEPFGYLIRHPECGCVLFATDTYYLRYRFNGLSNILIECNYSLDILRDNMRAGRIDHKRYERTVKSHMSFSTCRETLLANDLSKVNNIVLVHLSADNSNAADFVQGIREATGKNVVAATTGLDISFNKTPY